MTPPLSPDAQRAHAALFLRALFEHKPAGAVVMVMQEGRWQEASAYRSWQPVVERFGQADIYVGACALVRKPGKGSRGKASEAGFLPGAWADVDINGSPIKGSGDVVTGRAPSTEAAIRAIVTLCPPTFVVISGYGLQPWWLLERGLVLADAGMQRRAERTVQGIQRRLEHDAGWKVDSTGDLARVMGLPGTINAKGKDPAPVKLTLTGGPRYQPEQLERLAGKYLDDGAGDEGRGARPRDEWVQVIRNGDAGPGATRHERIWQLAGYLLRRDIDPAVAFELVRAFNDARLSSPYDEQTVRKHFDGIARLEIDRRRRERAGRASGKAAWTR